MDCGVWWNSFHLLICFHLLQILQKRGREANGAKVSNCLLWQWKFTTQQTDHVTCSYVQQTTLLVHLIMNLTRRPAQRRSGADEQQSMVVPLVKRKNVQHVNPCIAINKLQRNNFEYWLVSLPAIISVLNLQKW